MVSGRGYICHHVVNIAAYHSSCQYRVPRTIFSVTEGEPPPNQYPNIKLVKNKEIVQPLKLQLIPLMTADQYRALNFQLPAGTSLSNPAQCK